MSIPKKLYNISQSQFSVARYSGSAKINGKTYYYNPVDDSLTLDSEMEKVYRLKRWGPNRLRHARATELREHGLDNVATILGHSKLETSQVYSEKNLKAAMELMAKVG